MGRWARLLLRPRVDGGAEKRAAEGVRVGAKKASSGVDAAPPRHATPHYIPLNR